MYKNTTDFCILTVNYHKEKLRKVLLTNRINKNTTSRNKPNWGKRLVFEKLSDTNKRNWRWQTNGNIYSAHELEELMSLKLPYYPRQSTDSMSLSQITNDIFLIFLMTELEQISLKCVHVCQVTSVVSNSLQPYELEPKRFLCPWGTFIVSRQ